MDLVFEWGEGKASANLQKHGVSFEEAQTVFGDPRSITIFDAEHSTDADRFIDLGLSAEGRLLAVVSTERGERIRIIGSRQATLTERKQYEQR
jgi:uncharacterized DUF497 family protein